MTLSVHTEHAITFRSKGQPSYLLEGIVHMPAQIEHAPVVILCHPQPASSSMQDLLTVALAKNLADSGVVALRFNFRGVGKSQGQQSDGRMEPLDLAGAIDVALTLPGVNPAKLCVLGHGFGAYVTLMYAPFDTRIRTLIAISLPLFRATTGIARPFERPKLFIAAEFDEICPLFKLEPFVEQLPGPKGIKVVVGARNLMHGFEDAASTAVLKYVRTWAEMPGV